MENKIQNGKNHNGQNLLNPLNGIQKKQDPKKFLFITIEALAIDLAWRIFREGHEVKFYIEDKSCHDVGEGFVEKVSDWKPWKDWADVIIFDDIGKGELADKWRKEGKIVIGTSVYTDKLEDDREFGQSELNSVGVAVLPNWMFTDFDEAVQFIKRNPGRYVLKPSGQAQNEKELLVVGREENGEDLIQVLEHYKKAWSKSIKIFQLQQFAAGVEVAVGAFFNGKEFILPININFEHKKMFPGDIGPSTGEMGTTMYWSKPNRIFEMTLKKMESKLAASGYVGYIDLNCIANSRGVFPLEFTSRFGYPTLSIHDEGMLSKWGDFFYEIGKGNHFDLKTKKGFQIGIVVAVPPFPFDDIISFERYSKDAIIIFKKSDLAGIHIGDVKYIDGDWRLAGSVGYGLIITATGNTMENARKTVYERLKNIIIPNMFYRTDIGKRWSNDSDLLMMWDYI